MSMVPLIQAIMENSPEVKAQLGDPVRFRPGPHPEGTPLPNATWETVGGAPLNLLSETPPADGWRIRITVWGKTLSQVNAAAVAIRTEIERRGEIESYNPTPDDAGTGEYGISFDARILSVR